MGNRPGLGQVQDQAKIEADRIKPDLLVRWEASSLSRPRLDGGEMVPHSKLAY